MHIARYAYLSTIAWRRFHRHSMLRFPDIASQRQLVKSHFMNHPSLPHHNSPENRVSGTRRAIYSTRSFSGLSENRLSSIILLCSEQHEPGQFSRLTHLKLQLQPSPSRRLPTPPAIALNGNWRTSGMDHLPSPQTGLAPEWSPDRVHGTLPWGLGHLTVVGVLEGPSRSTLMEP